MVEKLDGISPKPSEGLSEWDVTKSGAASSIRGGNATTASSDPAFSVSKVKTEKNASTCFCVVAPDRLRRNPKGRKLMAIKCSTFLVEDCEKSPFDCRRMCVFDLRRYARGFFCIQARRKRACGIFRVQARRERMDACRFFGGGTMSLRLLISTPA